jgi:6-phosphofructokinase 1
LIYLPELAFNEERFLEDVDKLQRRHGSVSVVCSEGLTNENGELLTPPVFTSGRSVYPGYSGMYLANMVIEKLGVKARYEKTGLCERNSMPWQSDVDRAEAVEVGRMAVRAALNWKSGVMIGIERISSQPYEVRFVDIPFEKVMLFERKFPLEWLNSRDNDITKDFTDWCRPIAGGGFGEYLQFTKQYAKGKRS